MAQSMPNGMDLTMVAEESFAALQYRAVKAGVGTGRDIPCLKCGTSDQPLGIVQNDPASGEEATVRTFGTSKVVAAGPFSRYDKLAVADANGRVDTATGASAYTIGWAMQAATAAGDVVEAFLHLETVADSDLVGDLADLTTTAQTNTVAAINEVDAALDAGGSIVAIPVAALASIAADDLLLNGYTPGFAGKVAKLSFVTGLTPASTASKDIDLAVLIGATQTTGGLLTLLTADVNAKGKVKNATAITGGNSFGATDTISLKCVEATAAFAEGNGTVLVVLTRA